MVEHDALGSPRRSGRVADRRDVVGPYRSTGISCPGPSAVHPRNERLPGLDLGALCRVAGVPSRTKRRERRPARGQEALEELPRAHEEQAGAARGDDLSDLGGGARRIERNGNGADEADRQIDCQVPRAVRPNHADPVPGCHAEVPQRRRCGVDITAQIGGTTRAISALDDIVEVIARSERFRRYRICSCTVRSVR